MEPAADHEPAISDDARQTHGVDARIAAEPAQGSAASEPRSPVAATSETASGPPHTPVTDPQHMPPATTRRAARSRSGRGLSIVCALVALVASFVAMAAPWLRPQADRQARIWLGEKNFVSTLVMPAPPPKPKLTEDMLLARLAGFDAEFRAMSGTIGLLRGDVTTAAQSLRDAAAGTVGLTDVVNGLKQRADRLDSMGTMLDARSRSANMLALTVGLRRDIDTGLPLDHDTAALKAMGPFPQPVAHALDQLQGYSAGVPTMRDLAEGYQAVQAQLAARYRLSPLDRGWVRVKSLFGDETPSANEVMFNHLRDLVADGRFTEASKILETSDSADIAADWIGMVHARAISVIATQIVLNYALHSTEQAYASGGLRTGELSQ